VDEGTPLYAVYRIADEQGHKISKNTVEAQKLPVELKPLPTHLKYEFLDKEKTLPVIVSSDLSEKQSSALLDLLRKYRKVIGYCLDDIKGINPSLCNHRIYLEEGSKPSREHQRRTNPKLQEVVKKEILKLLSGNMISPSQTVSG
jgi:hypothetical protein